MNRNYHGEYLGGARSISFLLVEDNEDHAQLMKRSFASSQISNTVDRVNDGAEALDYLFQRGKYAGKALPDVILLDLNLPKVSGHEVLGQIKKDPRLKVIPVVILTTSAAETDRARAYQDHANSYLVKPLDFNSFRKMVDDLSYYWGIWNQSAVLS